MAQDRLITKGAFLEAELAPLQLEDVTRKGIAATVAAWKTWLYDDGGQAPIVGHLNGAVAVPWATAQALYGGVASGAGQKWQRELSLAANLTSEHA